MAIKYGRPIESRTRFTAVEQYASSSPALDLATRPRRNRRDGMGAPHGARKCSHDR